MDSINNQFFINNTASPVITDNPGVSELLTQAHTKALTDREAAMESAIDTFMRGKGGYDMHGFLTEFKENEKPRAVSVVYDGLGSYVEEQDARGAWRLVKGESDFMDDLMKAYTRYNLTNAAVEYNKGKSLPTLNREQVSQGG
ncbi:hypothetical protein [Herbaspirillum lusitanum]|uniref:hypothetical protein n=1 Tax=Herbaspirillum lusitanum TaxID=213312 RepID=UPI0002D8B597|nr:hypothetical protein [Herbaspirillum lusitanum]